MKCTLRYLTIESKIACKFSNRLETCRYITAHRTYGVSIMAHLNNALRSLGVSYKEAFTALNQKFLF